MARKNEKKSQTYSRKPHKTDCYVNGAKLFLKKKCHSIALWASIRISLPKIDRKNGHKCSYNGHSFQIRVYSLRKNVTPLWASIRISLPKIDLTDNRTPSFFLCFSAVDRMINAFYKLNVKKKKKVCLSFEIHFNSWIYLDRNNKITL